jgi:hypothetical protein
MNKVVAVAIGLAIVIGYIIALVNPKNTKADMQVLAVVGGGLILSAIFVWG